MENIRYFRNIVYISAMYIVPGRSTEGRPTVPAILYWLVGRNWLVLANQQGAVPQLNAGVMTTTGVEPNPSAVLTLGTTNSATVYRPLHIQ